MDAELKRDDACRVEVRALEQIRQRLPQATENIIGSCDDTASFTHIDYEPIPNQGRVVKIIAKLREVLFPGFFSHEKIDPSNLRYSLGRTVTELNDLLAEQITSSVRHDCFRYDLPCSECEDLGKIIALDFLEAIPDLRRVLADDVRAIYEGDPAAKSHDEIIFSYPGILALTVYRAAHKLLEFKVPLLPRIMTEYAHHTTGIDIHPGAEIGRRFAIDHGTGIVIGETTVIGNNVRIYQGVTLGALSLPQDAGERYRGKKRHPTIEDDVIIYSGATILGADAVIGARSVIGGNVWLTGSVPPDTKVMIEAPRLIYK